MSTPLRVSGTPRVRSVTIQEVLDGKRESLALELLTPDVPLNRLATDADLSSPGLALAGFTARLPEGRIWVFGVSEMCFLDTLPPNEATANLERLLSFGAPAVIVTKGQAVPDHFLKTAAALGVPVILSRRSTREVYQRLKPYLEATLAPTVNVHGSLADVYGVGLLFVGESGIGKSECVLDLVERGHRLVADDLVLLSRRGNDVLIGTGHELQRHHMEIRGVGIIDIMALFGVRAVRQQKRIEVVVQLETWDAARTYSRTGLEEDEIEILDVKVPRVTLPLNPGKNITVVAEVVAMNHLLKYTGIHSAHGFDERIRNHMKPIREYLEQDYE